MNTNKPFFRKESFIKEKREGLDGKTLRYALPFVVVIAVLLAFSSPGAADYSGDHPLTTYEHGLLKNGGLVYVTVEDGSAYTKLMTAPPGLPLSSMTQNITISIPEGATVKTARLYNYYTWSKSNYGNKSVPGDPAEADLMFNGIKVTCQNPSPITNPIDYGNGVVQYWDSKGQGYFPPGETTYDFPSGTFAWDVTDMVTSSGTYTATIANNDSTPTPDEYFCTFGFGLLVVYEYAAGPVNVEYWIAEGCDYLMAKTYETPEDATTSASFDGVIHWGNPEKIPWTKQEAELITVLTASDKGTLDPPQNMVSFNSEEIGPSTAANDKAIGVNYFDVTEELIHKDNIAEFQDRDDCEVVCNAFLVIEKTGKK